MQRSNITNHVNLFDVVRQPCTSGEDGTKTQARVKAGSRARAKVQVWAKAEAKDKARAIVRTGTEAITKISMHTIMNTMMMAIPMVMILAYSLQSEIILLQNTIIGDCMLGKCIPLASNHLLFPNFRMAHTKLSI